MSVLASSRVTKEGSGPRRLDPVSDLAEVASLIEEAFADELDREGRQALQELRQVDRFGLFLSVLRFIGLQGEDILSGFVWEEDGHVVGNVSVNLVGRLSPQWRISNVAVKLPYRNRSIARQLMGVAIDHVRQGGGRSVYLQVRDDNSPALHLYHRLGFQDTTAETEMYLPLASGAPDVPDTLASLRPRPLRAEEWPQVYDLALAATSAEDQRFSPLQKIDFELDWLQQLSDMLTFLTSGQRIYRFAIDGQDGLAAYLSVITARRHRGHHRLHLLVKPAYQGQVERALIRTALLTVAHHIPVGVEVRFNPVKKHEIEALEAFGFQKRRTLLTLELRLSA